jgi:hypothetical protein
MLNGAAVASGAESGYYQSDREANSPKQGRPHGTVPMNTKDNTHYTYHAFNMATQYYSMITHNT